MPDPVNIIPKRGERALVVGKTGSGKTSFVWWMLQYIKDSPIVIMDTKIEPKFLTLPNVTVVERMEDIPERVDSNEFDYIVVRPSISIIDDHVALDNMLLWFYHNMQGFPIYVDEVLTFHSAAGRCGKGMIALMTRGRSKGITAIMSSQRPVSISRYCITEAQKLYIFRLQDRRDRVRFDDVIEDFSKQPMIPDHYFYYIDHKTMETPIKMAPIKLSEEADTGYVDETADDDNNVTSSIWI